MKMPFVTCITITANRPKLLSNCLACYKDQAYPAEFSEHLILDDADQFPSQSGDGWRLISVPNRFHSLHEKINAAFSLADPRTEIFAFMDDDDYYGHQHLTAHVEALRNGNFSKPSKIYSAHGPDPTLIEENAVGRFCGSVAFTRALLDRVGGWPACKRGDTDQHVIQLLQRQGIAVDPCGTHAPQYVYRYGTGMYHASCAMTSPNDTDWWDKVPIGTVEKIPVLVPQFDAETLRIMEKLTSPLP